VSPIGVITDPEVALTEVQAEAILNMRLRSLRRLEELELIAERDALRAERAGLIELLGSVDLQWSTIADQLRETRKQFGRTSPGGARRTQFAEAGEVVEVPFEAMIEKNRSLLSALKWGGSAR
jgi:topoisomerase-4 subunit A